MTNPNVTSKYEEERLRAAEQSQIVYLQSQIDELRRLIKEQNNKYTWATEQVRKAEGQVVQVEGLLDRLRQEVTQALDGYRRDIATLRKELSGALLKIEEGLKPIREMQAQIRQLGEARKQDRDATAGWLTRIEALEERNQHWPSQFKELDSHQRALGEQIGALSAVDEQIRADIRRFGEELQVEKQMLRRQSVEAQQLVTDIRPTIEAHQSRLDRLDEIRKQIDLFAEQLPGQIAMLDKRITLQVDETKRVERISTERFLMNQERVEEIRRQQDERITALQEADEVNLHQLTSWLERIDGWVRELEQRHTRTVSQLEQHQRAVLDHLNDLETRDIGLIDTLLNGLRSRMEQVKASQIEQNRVPTTTSPQER